MTHIDENFRAVYRSPFDDDPPVTRSEPEHLYWWHFREEYAKTGENRYLLDMLRYVTLDNPPDALRKIEPIRVKSKVIRCRSTVDFFGWLLVALVAIFLVIVPILVHLVT